MAPNNDTYERTMPVDGKIMTRSSSSRTVHRIIVSPIIASPPADSLSVCRSVGQWVSLLVYQPCRGMVWRSI